jgi:hypothetical protein
MGRKVMINHFDEKQAIQDLKDKMTRLWKTGGEPRSEYQLTEAEKRIADAGPRPPPRPYQERGPRNFRATILLRDLALPCLASPRPAEPGPASPRRAARTAAANWPRSLARGLERGLPINAPSRAGHAQPRQPLGVAQCCLIPHRSFLSKC